ncbi:hydroxyisourate hydrolase [Acuticoccus kandeliae]|uniref:hydroxyisourate hydrolase n=1 Tax=Acuticoccus kandeliae TaxID=2073160 RepID=UPI000D3E2BD5|nr:hydroxyisourate hydrolase [Acuticoccus kandeliae]
MTGYLSTHVLDTAHGMPASGVAVGLFDSEGEPIARGTTDADGRVPSLLAGEDFLLGSYTLEFEIGDYYRRLGLDLPDPAFLETVVIAFGVSDEGAHYHVPLLVSPYGYTTYRGS